MVAPSEVRPGQTYRIIVTLLSSKQPLNFMASLQRDGEEIASAQDLVSIGDTKALLMKVRRTNMYGVTVVVHFLWPLVGRHDRSLLCFNTRRHACYMTMALARRPHPPSHDLQINVNLVSKDIRTQNLFLN